MKIRQSTKILNKFSLLPVNIIWFDYRGMGVSDKKSTLSLTNLKTDALGIFDYSKKTLPQHLPMAIHGLSMGSIIASYVAVNKDVDALILDGAISSVSTLVDNLMPTWSKAFYSVTLSVELAEIDNSDFIKDYTKPLLLIIGADDSITPPANSEQLYQLSPSQIKVLALISDTEHAMTMKKSQTIKAYLNFINTITCCKSS
jgi:alpha-beta hydrolase superfamily lysophospholipase